MLEVMWVVVIWVVEMLFRGVVAGDQRALGRRFTRRSIPCQFQESFQLGSCRKKIKLVEELRGLIFKV